MMSVATRKNCRAFLHSKRVAMSSDSVLCSQWLQGRGGIFSATFWNGTCFEVRAEGGLAFDVAKEPIVMSRLISFISAAIAAVLCFAPTTQAAPITFTATGNADVTGFVTFDDSVFNGTTFQFVRNTDILALSLTVLGVSFDLGDVVTADFAIIDSSGLTPIIVNGAGFLANNGAGRVIDFRPESSALPLDGDASLEFQSDQAEPVYLGVRWLIGDATAVPEPGAVALFGAGLAGLGWLRRRRTAA